MSVCITLFFFCNCFQIVLHMCTMHNGISSLFARCQVATNFVASETLAHINQTYAFAYEMLPSSSHTKYYTPFSNAID